MMHPGQLLLLIGLLCILATAFFFYKNKSKFRAETLRRVLRDHGGFHPGKLLGAGREGIVFELAPERAIKIIFSRTDRDPEIERKDHAKKLDVIRDNGLDQPPFVVDIHGLGEFVRDGKAYPYQICERIEGHTLRDELKKGSLRIAPLRERLTRLIQLITALNRLAAHNLHFVHIDDCNLMVDTQGRWRLIDFDALELGGMDYKTRKRFMRRLARVILEVLGNDWRKADFGAATDEVRKTLARLKTIEATPKGEKPARGTSFKTLADLRASLELAAASLKD